jgi:thioredoxin
MSIILTDENFEKEIRITDKMALVDFYATWCEPCSLLAPILEKLAKEFEDKIVLLSANVDSTRQNAQKFQVDRIPMVVLFKNGWPISAFAGFKPEPVIKEWLEKMIQDNLPTESSEDNQDKIEEMIKNFSEYAQKNGFQLNPDR